MKKNVTHSNGSIHIEINENPDAVVLPHVEHTITLIVSRVVNGQLDDGHFIWNKKPVKIEEGSEASEIKTLLASALTLGKKYIDVNFRQGGSPIHRALLDEGFEDM